MSQSSGTTERSSGSGVAQVGTRVIARPDLIDAATVSCVTFGETNTRTPPRGCSDAIVRFRECVLGGLAFAQADAGLQGWLVGIAYPGIERHGNAFPLAVIGGHLMKQVGREQ